MVFYFTWKLNKTENCWKFIVFPRLFVRISVGLHFVSLLKNDIKMSSSKFSATLQNCMFFYGLWYGIGELVNKSNGILKISCKNFVIELNLGRIIGKSFSFNSEGAKCRGWFPSICSRRIYRKKIRYFKVMLKYN